MGYAVQPFELAQAPCGIGVFFAISFMSLLPADLVTLNCYCKCTDSPSSVFTAAFSHGAGGA